MTSQWPMPKNLSKIRKKADLTQDELAQRIGIVRTQITKWEKGDKSISLRWLMKLAETLNVTVAELIGEANRPLTGDLIWQVIETIIDQARNNPELDRGLLTAIAKAVYQAADEGRLALPKTNLSPKKIETALVNETSRLIHYEVSKRQH